MSWGTSMADHSALADDRSFCLCEGCKARSRMCHNGNERAALLT